MITSSTNPKLKLIRRLLQESRTRRKEQAFVVEGSRWMQELLAQQVAPLWWLATESWVSQNGPLHEAVAALARPPLLVDEKLLRETADTENPSGVLAVVPFPEQPWPATPSFLLVLDGLQDPGNVGTLLRTAAAAGVEGVLLGPGTVDVTNPKVVRSSMGAILRLPQRSFQWGEIDRWIGPCRLISADGNGATVYSSLDWREPAALVLGNEGNGLSPAAQQAADQVVSIPMANATESLNAAVAGAVILFEAQRQKRAG